MATIPETPRLLRMYEVAERLAISKSKAYALAATGVLPVVRLTGSIRVPERALEELIARETRGP